MDIQGARTKEESRAMALREAQAARLDAERQELERLSYQQQTVLRQQLQEQHQQQVLLEEQVANQCREAQTNSSGSGVQDL